MQFRELEFKYKADHLTPIQFTEFVEKNFGITRCTKIAGVDYFFATEGQEDRFVRFRSSPNVTELTIKIKSNTSNSWNRLEVDVPLDRDKINFDTIDTFITQFNYQYQYTLAKTSYVMKNDKMVYAYYIVNDVDAYIEIEATKGSFKDTDEAFARLQEAEDKLGELGISYTDRTKLSLYEMYKD